MIEIGSPLIKKGNLKNSKCTIEVAIKVLTEKLKKDEDYFYGWQSNIAMAFQDEYIRTKDKNTINIHDVANIAAENFLTILIGDSK